MDDVLTTRDLQKKLHIGKNLAYKLIKQPDFPSVQIGKKYVVLESRLEEYLLDNEHCKVFS